MSSESVDEDNLKISNSPTDGYVLTAQSGNAGGLTWAADSTTDSTKLPLAGGTMTGNIVLGTNTVGGLAIQISEQSWGDTLGLGENAVSSITGSGSSGGYAIRSRQY